MPGFVEGWAPKKTMRGILPKARGYSHGGVPPFPHEDQNVQTPGEEYRRLRIVGDPAEKRMRGIIAKKHADIAEVQIGYMGRPSQKKQPPLR